MTPDATRLGAAIRAWSSAVGGPATRRDADGSLDWSDYLAAHLVEQGVRWARPVEDVQLPEVTDD